MSETEHPAPERKAGPFQTAGVPGHRKSTINVDHTTFQQLFNNVSPPRYNNKPATVPILETSKRS